MQNVLSIYLYISIQLSNTCILPVGSESCMVISYNLAIEFFFDISNVTKREREREKEFLVENVHAVTEVESFPTQQKNNCLNIKSMSS